MNMCILCSCVSQPISIHDDTHTGSKVTAPSLNFVAFMVTQLDTGEAALLLFLLLIMKNKQKYF